ncbi:MAG: hypothetical protein EOO72_02890, partial [Myxococcaceae bacterium]
MFVRAQRRGAHLRDKLPERRPRTEAAAQHQRVDEEANQTLRLRVMAVRDGRAHQHVVLTGVAVQHGLEGSQQHHERRGAFTLGQGLHLFGEIARQVHGHRLAAPGGDGRTRLVGGQLQHEGCTRQLLLPPAELLLQRVTLEPVALPHRVVCI